MPTIQIRNGRTWSPADGAEQARRSQRERDQLEYGLGAERVTDYRAAGVLAASVEGAPWQSEKAKAVERSRRTGRHRTPSAQRPSPLEQHDDQTHQG